MQQKNSYDGGCYSVLLFWPQLMHKLADSVPPDGKIFLVPGPVDNKGLPLDSAQVDKMPEAAVIAVVTVVTHDEQRMFGNGYGTHIVTTLNVCRQNLAVKVNGVRFILGFAVDINGFILDFNGIPCHADYSFNIVLGRIYRVFENNNIPSLRVLKWYPGMAVIRVFHPVYEFIDEDMVSDQEGVLHGSGGDFKGLDDKGPDKKGKK